MEPIVLLDGAGRRRSAAHNAGSSPRSGAAQQGLALSRRSADRRGDRARHAPRRRSRSRPALTRADRRHVACRASRQRDTRIDRERPRRGSRRDFRASRQGQQASRGRHGPVGLDLLRPWLAYRVQIPVGPLFRVIDGRTRGRPPTTTSVRHSWGGPLRRRECGAGSLRTSCGMRTRSRWRGRGGAQRHPPPTGARQPRDHVRLHAGSRERPGGWPDPRRWSELACAAAPAGARNTTERGKSAARPIARRLGSGRAADRG